MVGPFADAKDMAFNIPRNPIGAVDCYIDYLCTICVDLDSNAERCASAFGLAVEVVGRPFDLDDSLPRDALLSLKKLQGEGQQAEIKMNLGWELKSWSLKYGFRIYNVSWSLHMPRPKH
jgi:predicted DsbA family dithiol-disulfide isomerase